MRAVDIIRKKRDAVELSREEINFLIEGATHDRIPDYQLAAWLMAVLWRGMTRPELAALTEAMLTSGSVLDWSALPAPQVDKHSTGGVGDKTSLVIAPIVAAAGLYVPMISGRGLGHSGILRSAGGIGGHGQVGSIPIIDGIPGIEHRRMHNGQGAAGPGRPGLVIGVEAAVGCLVHLDGDRVPLQDRID